MKIICLILFASHRDKIVRRVAAEKSSGHHIIAKYDAIICSFKIELFNNPIMDFAGLYAKKKETFDRE